MPDQVFEIVPKDVQEQHIAKDMRDAAVHEHRAEKIEIHRQRRLEMTNLARVSKRISNHLHAADIDTGGYLFRDESVGIIESLVAAELLQQQKNEDINADEDVIYDRHDRPV